MRINYTPQAAKELREIVSYYEENLPGLGDEFIEELDKQIKYCSNSPEIGMLIDDKHRRMVMNRFPFNIVYRIVQYEIQILAVAHQHRKPGYWIKRIKNNNRIKEPTLDYMTVE